MASKYYYKQPSSSAYSIPNYNVSGYAAQPVNADAVGVPSQKTMVSRRDVGVLLIQLACLTAALLTIFYQPLAIWLGQLDQLIVLGFLLGVMALFLQEQVLQVVLVFMGYKHTSTLQDLDAFVRKDMLAPQISLYLRLILLSLIGLPLGLSAAYKLFVGGTSTQIVNSFPSGTFGYSATPGNQRIGDGLTLLSDIYRPFWIDPAIGKAYGFNLYIASNTTAVIPDTPYPSYLSSIQSTLAPDELLTLSTTVNATVATLANPTPAQRNSSDYWTFVLNNRFGHDPTVLGGNTHGANNALLAGMGANDRTNFSVAFYSAWNSTAPSATDPTQNETFFSEALRIENYRALYHVTWNISSTSTNLTRAQPVNPLITDLASAMGTQSNTNQSIIQNDRLGIQEMFSNFLGEYDWHNRREGGFFDYPYPTAPGEAEKWVLAVDTVPALSAAMVWARMTSLNAGDRPVRDPDRVVHTVYSKAVADVHALKTIPTLQRSALLAAVVCANPAIAVVCLLLKCLMWRSPVGPGFNIVALLAASKGADVAVLRGAGLSGKLTRRVGVRFFVDRTAEEEGSRLLGLEIDGAGMNEKLTGGVIYG